jgi:hypothetical protein
VHGAHASCTSTSILSSSPSVTEKRTFGALSVRTVQGRAYQHEASCVGMSYGRPSRCSLTSTLVPNPGLELPAPHLRLLKDLISCELIQSQRTDLLRYIPACRIRLSENLPQTPANGR